MAELPFAARLGVTTSALVLGLVMIVISPFDELPLIRGKLSGLRCGQTRDWRQAMLLSVHEGPPVTSFRPPQASFGLKDGLRHAHRGLVQRGLGRGSKDSWAKADPLARLAARPLFSMAWR